MKISIICLCLSLAFLSCKENTKTDASNKANDAQASVIEQTESQKEVKIIPIEHATAVLEWDGTSIYVDPVGGASLFEGQKEPDLILITDIHGDHLNVETLQALSTSNATFVVPKAVAEQMPEAFKSQLKIMENGENAEVNGVGIEAIPMYNLREEAKDFHVKGRGNGYVLTIGGQRIYFSGDTEDIPEMRSLKNIDKAFVCMNLPYTMTVESAASAVLEFKPKQVYPYHFRGRPDVSNVAKFKQLVNDSNPEIEVVQLDWYPKEDY